MNKVSTKDGTRKGTCPPTITPLITMHLESKTTILSPGRSKSSINPKLLPTKIQVPETWRLATWIYNDHPHRLPTHQMVIQFSPLSQDLPMQVKLSIILINNITSKKNLMRKGSSLNNQPHIDQKRETSPICIFKVKPKSLMCTSQTANQVCTIADNKKWTIQIPMSYTILKQETSKKKVTIFQSVKGMPMKEHLIQGCTLLLCSKIKINLLQCPTIPILHETLANSSKRYTQGLSPKNIPSEMSSLILYKIT